MGAEVAPMRTNGRDILATGNICTASKAVWRELVLARELSARSIRSQWGTSEAGAEVDAGRMLGRRDLRGSGDSLTLGFGGPGENTPKEQHRLVGMCA